MRTGGFPRWRAAGQAGPRLGQLGDERTFPVEGGRARLDLEPGRYVLVVFAMWPGGDAVLTFGLEAV